MAGWHYIVANANRWMEHSHYSEFLSNTQLMIMNWMKSLPDADDHYADDDAHDDASDNDDDDDDHDDAANDHIWGYLGHVQ